MYKTLGTLAAAVMLVAIAIPGPAAAEQRQGPGIHKQVSGEEFSAQRRYHRRYVVRRHYAPRRFVYRRYGPRYYHPYPYYAYGAYPYGYYSPGPFVRFGPFGFGFGF